MIGFIGAGKVGSSLSRFFYEYYVHKGINLLALSSIYSKHVTSANETISLLKRYPVIKQQLAYQKSQTL